MQVGYSLRLVILDGRSRVPFFDLKFTTSHAYMKHLQTWKIKDLAMLALALLATMAVGVGCQSPDVTPGSAQIESLAMRAHQTGDARSERRLIDLAAQGLPVAQRELGLLFEPRPKQRNDALQLFESAARAGDSDAAFELGEMLRIGVMGVPAATDKAWPWYKIAAQQKHAKAALVLGMLYKNGDGVPRDAVEGAKWLTLASDLGNAHAMFLLAHLYREGSGVMQDEAKARVLLEEAAEHEYPPAIQELAMTVQTGDALTARDEARAAHLLKEASEHRHNNWNRF
jgi:TPR repeat protein